MDHNGWEEGGREGENGRRSIKREEEKGVAAHFASVMGRDKVGRGKDLLGGKNACCGRRPVEEGKATWGSTPLI